MGDVIIVIDILKMGRHETFTQRHVYNHTRVSNMYPKAYPHTHQHKHSQDTHMVSYSKCYTICNLHIEGKQHISY